jgi:DNA adenine methylase
MSTNLPHYVDNARPFLKWAGGKSQLLKQYGPFFSRREAIQGYYEPFLGSAALFFHLQPSEACLADVNEKLVEIYLVVQREVERLIEVLGRFRNNEEEYYLTRSQNPAELSGVERAARLIYLNKTCYNGLYRENKKGAFNVPFGRYKNPTICDPTRLRTASAALQGVKLQVGDFEEVVEPARPGDFVYFDPPYAPLNATSNFTSYNRLGFGLADQRRLSAIFDQLTTKGCRVMLSNSSVPLIHELYEGKGYRIVEIMARRFINSKADGRGPVTELLILNY